MRLKLWWIGAALALAAVGCGSSGHPRADPTTTASSDPPSGISAPTTATTSLPVVTSVAATTTVPDPVVVPPAIDAGYVDAVLVQLNHVYGNAQRIEIASHSLPATIPPMLRAIYGDAQLTRELNVFTQALLNSELDQANPNAADPKMSVGRLVSAEDACIEANVVVTDAASKTGPSSLPLVIVLRPKDKADDPQGLNLTPWSIAYEMSTSPGGADAC